MGDAAATLPSSGVDVPYPTYFAEELASKMIADGDTVVSAASNDIDLSAYAVRQADGHLDLLVINKNPSSSLTEQFQIQGFQPSGQATIWQYGETQDTAQSLSTNGQSASPESSTTLSLSGAEFNYTFPSYSMTVIDLTNVTKLIPTAVTPTPTGFTAVFNTAFDPTTLSLYFNTADVRARRPFACHDRGSRVADRQIQRTARSPSSRPALVARGCWPRARTRSPFMAAAAASRIPAAACSMATAVWPAATSPTLSACPRRRE